MPKQAIADTRTSKSTINLATGFLSQIIILVLNFLVRYIFVRHLGYNYLGINSLFSSILTILSVADLGFGSALGIVLYSSLAKKDEQEIAGLMNFFKKVYLTIGIIVTVAGLAITPFVKYLVNTTENIPNLSLYFLFFLANTVSSYFISYRAILIKADQKNSVVNNVTTIVKIAKAILEIFILLMFPKWFGLIPTYFSYLGVMVLATYAIGVMTSIYARKKYPYAFRKTEVSIEKKVDIVSTTKDLFVYKICNAFSSPIDSVLISLFVGTALLGIYSNYLLIFTTLMEFICIISRNTISSVGNFVVENKIKDQKKLYFEIQAVYFAIIVFCTINFVSLVSPFIDLVFKSESVLSNWVVFLFGLTLIVKCAGELSVIFRETTRIYKKTKYISLVYTGVHIVLSVVLGYFFGLEGILLGGVIAYFITNFWFEIYALFKWYFYENPLKTFLLFAYVIAITAGASVGSYYLCSMFIGKGFEYFAVSCLISLSISCVALLALYPLPGVKEALVRTIGIVKRTIPVIKAFYERIKLQKVLLISFFVVLISLVLVRDLAGVNIGKFVFLGVIVGFVIFLRKEYALIAMMFVLPFSSTLAEIYIHGFVLAYLVVTSLKKYSWKTWLIIFSVPLFLFGYEMVISTIYGGASIRIALRIFTLLSILGIIFYDRESFTKKHIYAFLGGCLFLFVMLALNWILPAYYAVTHRNKTQDWLTVSHLLTQIRLGYSCTDWIKTVAKIDYPIQPETIVAENPNNIGMLAIVGMSCCTSLLGTAKTKEKLALLGMFVLFVLFGIWCQSRMYLICVGIFILVYLVFFGLTKRVRWIDIGITFFTLLSIFSLVYLLKQDIFNNLFRRFFSNNEEKDGGRIRLLISYLQFVFSDWKVTIFGVGINNLKTVANLSEVPHSNFVQFLAAFGMINFVSMIAFVTFGWLRSKTIYKIRNPKLLLILPLFFLVLYTGVNQLFAPSIILITFVPTMICLSYLNKDNVKTIQYSPREPIRLEKGKKIKIALCANINDKKVATYVQNLIPLLSRNNFEVAIIFSNKPSEKQSESFSQLKCELFFYGKEQSKIGLVRLIKNRKYYKTIFNRFEPNVVYIVGKSFKESTAIQSAANSFRGAFHIYHSFNQETLITGEKINRLFFVGDKTIRFANSDDKGKITFGNNFGKIKSDNMVDAKDITDPVVYKDLIKDLRVLVYE